MLPECEVCAKYLQANLIKLIITLPRGKFAMIILVQNAFKRDGFLVLASLLLSLSI